jgi:hypothetical protein
LASLSLRYYYTKEPAGAEAFNCYYVSGGDCSLLAPPVFADLSPKTVTADRYLQLQFAPGAPSVGPNKFVELHGSFNVSSYQNFDQTNDYSFSTATTFSPATHVTLFANGVLIWGTPP